MCGAAFFFSSRRRHTRWPRDWSSDVCSSDLNPCRNASNHSSLFSVTFSTFGPVRILLAATRSSFKADMKRAKTDRSEERRVGKEGRWRATTEYEKDRVL